MAVVEEFHYLCRLCATKTGVLMGLPIFEAGEQMRNIDKKIAACLPVQVSMNDQLPKVVCEECAHKLDQLFDFHQKCLHTEGMFLEMLKEIAKQEPVHIPEETFQEVHNMNAVKNEELQAKTEDDCQNLEDLNEHCDNTEEVHTMHVMDEMDLAGGEQVITQEEISQECDTEVTGIICLDNETVQMVEEHVADVQNHHIPMDLEDDMSVVGDLSVGNLSELGISYVTSISPEPENREEIVNYCENSKYGSLSIENDYGGLYKKVIVDEPVEVQKPISHKRSSSMRTRSQNRAKKVAARELEETVETSTSTEDTMTSELVSEESEIMYNEEYTKKRKQALIQNTLNNPTTDETGTQWYVCPFCNEAATEPNSMSAHFEQHFCNCSCGLYYTDVDVLNLHKQKCKKKVKKKSTEVEAAQHESDTNTEDEPKKQSGVRQRWTPKLCPQCGKQYRTNYKLQEHMRKHTGEKPFQCTTCNKAFRSKIGLAQHTATHTGQFDYNCSTCGKGFQCKSYLIVHQRVHSDLKPYPCSICGQNFKTKQSLLDHENRHNGVKPYTCEICGRSFITKGLCKSHQKIHSGTDNRQYPCAVCNKLFVSKSYLNTHLRIHTGEKPYLCEVCGKGFLTRVDLKIHSTMHTGEKSFECEMCGKVFARRAALRCHRRSHTGERPYRCDVCGKTFTQFSPMAIHKRLHTGERPYPCDECGKAFVSRSTMMCHKKKNHPTPAPEKKDEEGEMIEEKSKSKESSSGRQSLYVSRGSHEGIQITAD